MWPFVVYGTLRAGGVRDRVWAGRATARAGVLPGFELRDTGRCYPIVTANAATEVIVDLLEATTSDTYEVLLRAFDEIEEIASGLYVRTLCSAVSADGHVTGWLYQPGAELLAVAAGLPTVTSGDWLRR